MVTIDVYPERVLGTISRYLTGACLEDVNHEVYGGIYSQMIFGESFEEEPMDIRPDLVPAFEGLEGTVSCLAEREHLRTSSEIRSWQPFRRGTARGRLKATQLRARRGVRSQRIEFAESSNPGIDARLKAHFGLGATDDEGLRQALGVDFRSVGRALRWAAAAPRGARSPRRSLLGRAHAVRRTRIRRVLGLLRFSPPRRHAGGGRGLADALTRRLRLRRRGHGLRSMARLRHRRGQCRAARRDQRHGDDPQHGAGDGRSDHR